MNATANKQLLQEIFAALAQSNSRPMVDAMADDFRWTMVGSNQWAKTYAGKQAVIGELFAALRRKMDRVTTIAHRFIAEGDHVVVEGARRKHDEGRPALLQHVLLRFRLADGKLAEVTEYMDSELVNPCSANLEWCLFRP